MACPHPTRHIAPVEHARRLRLRRCVRKQYGAIYVQGSVKVVGIDGPSFTIAGVTTLSGGRRWTDRSIAASWRASPPCPIRAGPRQAIGVDFIWGVIVSGLLRQHRTPAAIAHWAQRQATALVAAFRPARGRVPSESTLRRALQRVDVAALEAQVAGLAAPPVPAPPTPSATCRARHRWQTCAWGGRAWPVHRAGQLGGPPRGAGGGPNRRPPQTPRE